MTESSEGRQSQRRLAKAWTAPVRAVTRILNTSDLPPDGALPARHPDDAVVECGIYVDGHRRPGDARYADAVEAVGREGGFVWLELHEPGEVGFAPVARAFGLHELAAEQAVIVGHRPKIERYADVVLFALRTTRYVEHQELTETSEVVESGEVLIFVGEWSSCHVRGSPQDHDRIAAGRESDMCHRLAAERAEPVTRSSRRAGR